MTSMAFADALLLIPSWPARCHLASLPSCRIVVALLLACVVSMM